MTNSSLFYQSPAQLDHALRFGDVIRGFVISTPVMKQPVLEAGQHEYHVEVRIPELCAILSPCCSIGDQMIALSPLKRVLPSFFENPYLTQDLTNLNRKMLPEQAIPPGAWEKMPEEDRQKRLREGETYAFTSYFIYAEHEYLPVYSLRTRGGEIQTGCHMIDFRDIFKVHCQAILSAQKSPVEAKLAQLSVFARREMREKIGAYYLREPVEDRIALAAL